MNPIRYQTLAEKTDIIKSIPEDKLDAFLASFRAKLEAHLAVRPSWTDINARTKWAWDKHDLEVDIQCLEAQKAARWHPVERAS
ncbi:hypothetical protein [Mesoterricola silvestris]|uniref:Uncharacterized protein n=1 Tax=Mesoterricola silvestris TaxID=2927979 RepID=A0AA48GMN8_9BACT|nr:hypothetical protein [Mesoterricola silvestris]BDU72325.1 hypothetical protein METEAL_14990 [Mesoterricola silvestris]